MRTLALVITLAAHTALASPGRRFHIEQRYEVKPAAAPITIWLPLPLEDTWQRATDLSIEGAPFTVVYDERHGNAAARVELPAAGGALTVRFTIDRIERDSLLADQQAAGAITGKPAPNGYERWLKGDALIPLDARVKKIAADVTGQAK